MSTDVVVPLPVYPYPLEDARLSVLRDAKAQMGRDYKIVPVQGVPGSPGRILCWGQPAPFCAEHVVIAPENGLKVDNVRRALEFALEAAPGTPGSVDEEAWMSAVMGVPVTLIDIVTEEDAIAAEREERILGGYR